MKDKKQLPLEQKEKAVHGERIFPLKKYLTTLQERYPIVTPHWHEEAEFTLITSGVCTYQVDLKAFRLCLEISFSFLHWLCIPLPYYLPGICIRKHMSFTLISLVHPLQISVPCDI